MRVKFGGEMKAMNTKFFAGLLGVWMMAVSACPAWADVVVGMTCEGISGSVLVGDVRPRFGWQIKGAPGYEQSAYALEIRSAVDDRLLWKSGKIRSSESGLVPCGTNLPEGEPCRWRVRVWNRAGQPSGWSEWAEFRTAPGRTALDAEWIGAVSRAEARFPAGRNYHGGVLKRPEVIQAWNGVDSAAWRSICLRREFVVPRSKKIADAVIYICGLGHYELQLNGSKVGDSEFAPLWSEYEKTVYYNVYDVTDRLRRGENAVGVLLGNGFYNIVGGGRYRKLQIGFGPETLFFQLDIRYTDGSRQRVVSDADWRLAPSPITFNTLYGGEDYDARLEQRGWNTVGFDDSSWRRATIQEAPTGTLRPQTTEPVKIMHRYGVKEVHKLTLEEAARASQSTKRTVDASALLLDMGQNLAGFPEIIVRGRRGQRITLLVSEAVNADHAADQKQTGRPHYYTYTLKGEGCETWHPRFSYYGFRYIQVEGAVLQGMENPRGLPVIEDIRSCFVYHAAAQTGRFACSNELFNAVHRLIGNAVRSNMQAVFTDCPHREKLGWLEQVHLNGPGLFYNYNLATYMPKIMQDIADSQRPDGMVPTTAPCYVVFEGPGMEAFADSPEWGSTLIVLPFQYYEFYGDDTLIRRYYDNMRAYVDYFGTRAKDGLIDFGLGDWYDYGDFKAGFSRNTPVGLVASAYYYMDLDYLVRAARMVGNARDEMHYAELRDRTLAAFQAKYFDTVTCRYGSGSQCSYALPLFLGMVPEAYRQDVLDNLVADIRAHGLRLTTGDIGNRYLFQTLARNGLNDLMYAMHNHEEAPGYGFQLKFGATTLTEQWDPRQGASWNHFMMGQIDEWFYASLAGIRPDTEGRGFRHVSIRPEPVGDLSWVEASCETPYGVVAVSWKRDAQQLFTLKTTVPANCSADVWLPGATAPQQVGSGTYTFATRLKNRD